MKKTLLFETKKGFSGRINSALVKTKGITIDKFYRAIIKTM
jgi:hypothetical protein